MADALGLTPEEIEELAKAAFQAYWKDTVLEDYWQKDLLDRPSWCAAALAVVRRNRQLALERLARDLQDPNSAASKLRDELRDLRCAHCGRRLEEEA